MQIDGKALGEHLVGVVKSYVARALGAIESRVKALEESKLDVPALVTEAVQAAVKALPVPQDGKDADPAAIAEQVKVAVAEIPKPADGKSITVEEVQPVLADMVKAAVEALPKPKDGADADPEAVRALVQEEVAKLPAPAPGKDADPEKVAEILLPNLKQIIDGWPKPQDGKSITVEDMLPALQGAVDKWALDFERRAADVLQRAVERIPKPKDGIDGFNLEDMHVEHDGDGNVILRFVRGELTREFPLRFPRFKDCGIFRDGETFKQGDGVTWGGSFFIAQKDAPAGKPGESDDWRLAVKRGRDGKSAEPVAAQTGPVRLK